MDRHVVIVGASLAGLSTAEALRRAGYGGRLTLVGDEESLPYDRPPLSKAVLQGEATLETITLKDRAALDELQIDLVLANGASELRPDSGVVALADGTELVYDSLVVATGARARPLAGGRRRPGVHVLRTIEDAASLRRGLSASANIVVVGAGFIGSEVASVAAGLGLDVTMLTLDQAPLQRGVGPVLGEAMACRQRRAGVDLRCEVQDVELVGRDAVTCVRVDGEDILTDLVLVCIGAVPNVEWLAGSGVPVENGVTCDEFCRVVGFDSVYAVGDVACWLNPRYDEAMRVEHWTNAIDQASAVANTIMGTPTAVDVLPYVWSEQFGGRLQIFGRVLEGADIAFVRGDELSDEWLAVASRDGQLEAAVGFNATKDLMGLRRHLLKGASLDEALAG